MKKQILLACAIACAAGASAQMNVWENGNLSAQYNVENVDSVTFGITSETPVSGTGKDGITPLLKIENDYWFVSYDNGETWQQEGLACGEKGEKGDKGETGDKGEKGDSMLQSISYDSTYATFTLVDGTVLRFARIEEQGCNDFNKTIVDNLVNSFTLDKSTILLRTIGQKDTIQWETKPFSNSAIEWISSDNSVVSVENGVITAKGYGYATVTAKAATLTQLCNVYIVDETIKSFSLSDTNKVVFAPGNLQYKASTKQWRFAENPYDIIGPYNMMRSATYDGWIDLFSLGCNGMEWEPYEEGKLYYRPYADAGNLNYVMEDISKSDYDFGWNNKILGVDNAIHTWRMFTGAELGYLLTQRENAASLYTFATYNNVEGLILFPDNFDKPSIMQIEFTKEAFDKNVITDKDWEVLSAYGAVYLPLTGYYSFASNSIKQESIGYYWTSSVRDQFDPHSYGLVVHLSFTQGIVSKNYFSDGYYAHETRRPDHKYAFAVRLVKDIK